MGETWRVCGGVEVARSRIALTVDALFAVSRGVRWVDALLIAACLPLAACLVGLAGRARGLGSGMTSTFARAGTAAKLASVGASALRVTRATAGISAPSW